MYFELGHAAINVVVNLLPGRSDTGPATQSSWPRLGLQPNATLQWFPEIDLEFRRSSDSKVMASNIFSRFLLANVGEPSIYETLRLHDEAEHEPDGQEHGGFDRHVSPSEAPYHDDDVDIESLAGQRQRKDRTGRLQARQTKQGQDVDDTDDDVPQSLLIENDAVNIGQHEAAGSANSSSSAPIPGPSTRETHARWQATQDQQQLHMPLAPQGVQNLGLGHNGRPLGMTNPKEQAAWMWANVTNLDGFLGEIYDYYVGHGFSSILLSRLLKLL